MPGSENLTLKAFKVHLKPSDLCRKQVACTCCKPRDALDAARLQWQLLLMPPVESFYAPGYPRS